MQAYAVCLRNPTHCVSCNKPGALPAELAMTGIHVLADVMEYAGHSLDAELQQLALQLPHAAQQVRFADPSESCCLNSCHFAGQIRVMGGRVQAAQDPAATAVRVISGCTNMC